MGDRSSMAVSWVAGISLLLLLPLQARAGEEYATLLISSDTPCVLLIDDVIVRRLDQDVTTRIEVEPGYRNLAAFSLLTLEARWDGVLEAEEDELYAYEIALAEEVATVLGSELEPGLLFGEPESPIEDQGNGVVHDTDSDLYWTQLDSKLDTDWDAAERYCTNLQLGIEDESEPERPWRLPTISELETLLDDHSASEYLVLRGVRLSGCCPWSSEQHGSVSAWYLSFEDGRRGFVTRDYEVGGRALCVR